jgi:uncharacterized protein with PQ loop repeat
MEWMQEHVEILGWLATSLFTVSFVVKTQKSLLRAQMVAASLWLLYGVLIHKMPVVVANVLVASGSIYKQIRLAMEEKKNPGHTQAV